MKRYNVRFEINGYILSDFKIQAKNLKQAKSLAQMHKRNCSAVNWQIYRKTKTIVTKID